MKVFGWAQPSYSKELWWKHGARWGPISIWGVCWLEAFADEWRM